MKRVCYETKRRFSENFLFSCQNKFFPGKIIFKNEILSGIKTDHSNDMLLLKRRK